MASDRFVVVERWEGDDGAIVGGPLDQDEAADVADEREETHDDYAVVIVDEGSLELAMLHGDLDDARGDRVE